MVLQHHRPAPTRWHQPMPPTHPGLSPNQPAPLMQGERLPDPDPLPLPPPRDWRTVPLPARMRSLVRDDRGYLIFHAVTPPEGAHEGARVDFRILSVEHHMEVARRRLCAICGKRLGQQLFWIGGPMCILNRVFGDGHMHEDCARYALAVCPYLAIATKSYRYHDRDGEHASEELTDDNVIHRKPRMMVLAMTRECHLLLPRNGKPVFLLPREMTAEWYDNAGVYLARTRPDQFAQ